MEKEAHVIIRKIVRGKGGTSEGRDKRGNRTEIKMKEL